MITITKEDILEIMVVDEWMTQDSIFFELNKKYNDQLYIKENINEFNKYMNLLIISGIAEEKKLDSEKHIYRITQK